MSDIIPFPDDEGPLIDLPIVDFLVFDSLHGGWSITFVPQDSVSHREKESILLTASASEWLHFGRTLVALGKCLGGAVDRIAHGGGDHFTITLQDGSVITLQEGAAMEIQSLRVYDLLQRLGMIAQTEFLVRNSRRSLTA